jgi:hypothetical protein
VSCRKLHVLAAGDIFIRNNPRCLRTGKIDIDAIVPISPA